MGSVSVNPPKTPVTAGSKGVAAATVPNVCKMPGPPAPFVPTPLPNIGKSGDSPKGYSKRVKIDGKKVAIRGATFKSTGDLASKGTGGGLFSANTHGVTKFIGLGSLDTKIEGKNVHLLSDPMLNNCGPSGAPANAATLTGIVQFALLTSAMMFPETSDDDKDKTCTYGANHDWKCREAKGKKRLSQKIAEAGANPREGIRFEAAAAAHNKASGELTRSSQLSQDPHEEKIFWFCTICGIEREGDQIHDTPGGGPPQLVEVKSKSHLDTRDARQLGRNFQALATGAASAVIYKVPAGTDGNIITGQLNRLADIAGAPIRIIRI
jgi:hypothetical protein